jgi:low temperature requirement protein LtrA
MTWRIVSFKYTHIVERLQLLTLIIIGEGIIGMIKSVACITKGQTKNNSTELGSVVAAVVLLVSFFTIVRILSHSYLAVPYLYGLFRPVL